MSGALKLAWGLVAFVIVAGALGWILTDRAVFAVFIVLGVLTAAFDQVDVLVSPTTPSVAFPLGARVDDPLAMYAADLCTLPASLAGLPAISVPSGLSDGLPVGLQIMAPALADDRCYRVAAALEAALTADRGDRGFLDQLAVRQGSAA